MGVGWRGRVGRGSGDGLGVGWMEGSLGSRGAHATLPVPACTRRGLPYAHLQASLGTGQYEQGMRPALLGSSPVKSSRRVRAGLAGGRWREAELAGVIRPLRIDSALVPSPDSSRMVARSLPLVGSIGSIARWSSLPSPCTISRYGMTPSGRRACHPSGRSIRRVMHSASSLPSPAPEEPSPCCH